MYLLRISTLLALFATCFIFLPSAVATTDVTDAADAADAANSFMFCFANGAIGDGWWLDTHILGVCQSLTGWYSKSSQLPHGRSQCVNTETVFNTAGSVVFEVYNINPGQDQFMSTDGCAENMRSIQRACGRGGRLTRDDVQWVFVLDPNENRC